MAFRAVKRKEMKKQSYYVWFLGAKESKGLRGEEYIRPVLHQLLDREKEFEPTKVTLQVSSKGLKIVQNVPRKSDRGKTEQIKHFIPHHAITCALQEAEPDDDIVCCILLIYNPLTRCPVHVHGYRCDSVETANALRDQLQILIDRLDNQTKFREIENRLAAKGLLQSRRINSDGRSTRTEGSDQTEDSFGSEHDDTPACQPKDPHIASLYDSLAAELRERLGNPNNCPILLPAKDYDTLSGKRGRRQGIEQRSSTNHKLVGPTRAPLLPAKPNGRLKESVSSGKSSSGIGSEDVLSSVVQEVSSHFNSKVISANANSEEKDALSEDDRVRAVWQKYSATPHDRRRRSISSSCTPVSSPPTYLFGQREPIILRDKTREQSPKNSFINDLVTSSGCKNVDSVKFREREVVYRRRNNPAENIVPGKFRPLSYPSHQTQDHCRSSSLRPCCGEILPKGLIESVTQSSGSHQGRKEDFRRRKALC